MNSLLEEERDFMGKDMVSVSGARGSDLVEEVQRHCPYVSDALAGDPTRTQGQALYTSEMCTVYTLKT